MEESKELQGFYKDIPCGHLYLRTIGVLRVCHRPAMLDHWGGILTDIHGRIKRWMIYNDGNLVYSKVATFLLICITCIGTRNKKHLEFDARTGVIPIDKRTFDDRAVRMAVPSSDGTEVPTPCRSISFSTWLPRWSA